MKEISGEVRVIHRGALTELRSEELALAFIKVANDLRSGLIPGKLFNMASYDSAIPWYSPSNRCKTSHCIAGWVAVYMKDHWKRVFYPNGIIWNTLPLGSFRLSNLFAGAQPNNPQLAADAIEQYIYNFAEAPWVAAAKAGVYKEQVHG